MLGECVLGCCCCCCPGGGGAAMVLRSVRQAVERTNNERRQLKSSLNDESSLASHQSARLLQRAAKTQEVLSLWKPMLFFALAQLIDRIDCRRPRPDVEKCYRHARIVAHYFPPQSALPAEQEFIQYQ